MEALSPKLVQLIRSGVGLTTRAGVARFITMLTTVSPVDSNVFYLRRRCQLVLHLK